MGKRKSYSAEQIIMKLREVDVLIAQGKTVRELCRAFGQPGSTQRYQRREKEDEERLSLHGRVYHRAD